MMRAEDPQPTPQPNPVVQTVAIAVVTAACTTAATKLAEWDVEQLRAKFSSPPKGRKR